MQDTNPALNSLSESGICCMLSDVFGNLKADFSGLFCEKHALIKPISHKKQVGWERREGEEREKSLLALAYSPVMHCNNDVKA